MEISENNINNLRNRGGRTEIGSIEDGAIRETVKIGERLFIVKEKAIYEFMLADMIDPQREHPNLPSNTQRKIIDQGSESEIVCRTFLQASKLLRQERLNEEVNIKNSMESTLKMLIELIKLEYEIQLLISAEQQCIDEYNQRRRSNLDHMVPSIPDLHTRCKTIFQKAHHTIQFIIDIFKEFYPDYKNGLFKDMPGFITSKYPDDKQFNNFINDVFFFMELVRILRNAADHRKIELEISDFSLQLSNEVLIPTIELHEDHNISLNKSNLTETLKYFVPNLTYVFETLLAFCCSNNLKKNNSFKATLVQIPENERCNKFIKYGYLLPIPSDGYYEQ